MEIELAIVKRKEFVQVVHFILKLTLFVVTCLKPAYTVNALHEQNIDTVFVLVISPSYKHREKRIIRITDIEKVVLLCVLLRTKPHKM